MLIKVDRTSTANVIYETQTNTVNYSESEKETQPIQILRINIS